MSLRRPDISSRGRSCRTNHRVRGDSQHGQGGRQHQPEQAKAPDSSRHRTAPTAPDIDHNEESLAVTRAPKQPNGPASRTQVALRASFVLLVQLIPSPSDDPKNLITNLGPRIEGTRVATPDNVSRRCHSRVRESQVNSPRPRCIGVRDCPWDGRSWLRALFAGLRPVVPPMLSRVLPAPHSFGWTSTPTKCSGSAANDSEHFFEQNQ